MKFPSNIEKLLPAAVIAAVLLLGYPLKDESLPYQKPLVTSEIVCLAQTIFFEARGEPQDSRIGVALVVMNRTIVTKLPICSVVHKKIHDHCAFSYYCMWNSKTFKFRNDIDRTSWNDAVILAKYVERCYNVCMMDITLGATAYHTIREDNLIPTVILGHHEFFRNSL